MNILFAAFDRTTRSPTLTRNACPWSVRTLRKLKNLSEDTSYITSHVFFWALDRKKGRYFEEVTNLSLPASTHSLDSCCIVSAILLHRVFDWDDLKFGYFDWTTNEVVMRIIRFWVNAHITKAPVTIFGNVNTII